MTTTNARPTTLQRVLQPAPFIGPLIALALLCIVLAATKPFFYSSANILNILVTNTPLMIVAVGMTIAMISGGFDLSVGSVVAATGVALQLMISAGVPAILAILLALCIGIVFGSLVNGLLIAKAKLNFFVVTLGTMTTLSGLVYVITNGQTKTIDSELVYWIGNGDILGIPVPVVILALCISVAWYVLSQTPFGRNIYAVGGNSEAARLSGISVVGVTAAVYGLAGLFASLSGIVQAGLLSAGAPTAGASFALTAGAAVLLGGTSFTGGSGGVIGTVIGVLLIAVLQNGLGLFGVSSFWQDVVTGAVLIAAVAFDQFQRLNMRRRIRPSAT
jgi:ribose transport system permease protein